MTTGNQHLVGADWEEFRRREHKVREPLHHLALGECVVLVQCATKCVHPRSEKIRGVRRVSWCAVKDDPVNLDESGVMHNRYETLQSILLLCPLDQMLHRDIRQFSINKSRHTTALNKSYVMPAKPLRIFTKAY